MPLVLVYYGCITYSNRIVYNGKKKQFNKSAHNPFFSLILCFFCRIVKYSLSMAKNKRQHYSSLSFLAFGPGVFKCMQLFCYEIVGTALSSTMKLSNWALGNKWAGNGWQKRKRDFNFIVYVLYCITECTLEK